MNTINTIMKYPLLAMLSITFATITIQYMPTPLHLFWLASAVLLDLFTGLLKAWSKGQVTSSRGLRRTIIKIGSYVGTIVGVCILVNVIAMNLNATNKIDLSFMLNWLMGFMIFIELYSVFENIDEAYPDSIFSKYISSPILKFLKGKLKEKGPFNTDEIKNNTPAE